MNNTDIRPVFKKDTTVYIEKKSNPGKLLKTDIYKVRDDGNIEIFPPISENNIRISFKNGEDIVLYYWYEGVRFFCKTMIIEYINGDQVYSVVVPKKMSQDVVRKWKRYDINTPIVFLKSGRKEDDVVAEDSVFFGITLNLSGGGALIAAKKKLNVGDYLGIAFNINDEICIFDSKIIKVEASENPSLGFEVILEFFNFTESDKKDFDTLLKHYASMN
ncbi:MAG: flagellar brake domain-containing protein [Romboutsia sp.]|nr:flagellar brake domain-containing protein [Romboutsia sp.]